MPLTQEQLDHFHLHGYLKLGKVIEDAEIEQLRHEYDRVFAQADESGRYSNLTVAFGSDAATKKAAPRKMLQIINVCERSLAFRKLLYDQRILDVVQDLTGPNIMLFHDQALFKPAHHGGPIFWHQDNAYWKCRPANLVSCWITLDDADEANGAMQVIPGSHLTPLWHDPAQESAALIEMKGVDVVRRVVVELPAGGMMLHHCQTLHYTAPNSTDRQRRAFAIHYMPAGTRDSKGELMHMSYSRPMLRAAM